jgi:hypothetical protein
MELPPSAFSNAMNAINPAFNYQNWRCSPEWKIFMAGHTFALEAGIMELSGLRNLGFEREGVPGHEDFPFRGAAPVLVVERRIDGVHGVAEGRGWQFHNQSLVTSCLRQKKLACPGNFTQSASGLWLR